MNNKIISGVIKNMDTGEKTEMAHYALFPNYTFTAIVLVQEVKCYGENPDEAMEVDLNCKALDSVGMVYNLAVTFIPETVEEKATILQDMTKNSVHLFVGRYGFVKNEQLMMFDPEYRSVEPDFDEDEVRDAFRINERHQICQ